MEVIATSVLWTSNISIPTGPSYFVSRDVGIHHKGLQLALPRSFSAAPRGLPTLLRASPIRAMLCCASSILCLLPFTNIPVLKVVLPTASARRCPPANSRPRLLCGCCVAVATPPSRTLIRCRGLLALPSRSLPPLWRVRLDGAHGGGRWGVFRPVCA